MRYVRKFVPSINTLYNTNVYCTAATQCLRLTLTFPVNEPYLNKVYYSYSTTELTLLYLSFKLNYCSNKLYKYLLYALVL